MTRMKLRDYIDSLKDEGYRIEGAEGEDPQLIAPDGKASETWRHDYPYDELMSRPEYERETNYLRVYLARVQARHRLRGTRCRRQGWHHQALHRAPEPACGPRGGAQHPHRT